MTQRYKNENEYAHKHMLYTRCSSLYWFIIGKLKSINEPAFDIMIVLSTMVTLHAWLTDALTDQCPDKPILKFNDLKGLLLWTRQVTSITYRTRLIVYCADIITCLITQQINNFYFQSTQIILHNSIHFDGLSWHFVQTFMFPSGWILKDFVIPPGFSFSATKRLIF